MAKGFKNATADVYEKIMGSAEEQVQGQMEITNTDMDIESVNTGKIKKSVSSQKALELQEAQKTQGVKGAKMPRITMAFTPDNHKYLSEWARLKRITMTQLVNQIIEEDRKKNADKLEEIRKLMD